METKPISTPKPLIPRKVLSLLDNLFFAAKINQAAARASVQTIYAKTPSQALELARAECPSQIIVDLDAAKCSPLEFITELKNDPDLQVIPTLGFVSHINTDLQQQARKAGCDQVMARSAFDRNLASLFHQHS